MGGSFLLSLAGGSAALGAAALWAVAVAVYEHVGRHVRPISLNLFKCTVALLLLFVTLGILGELSTRVESSAVWLLLVSGAVGFGVGDTSLLKALQDLGTRRTLLFMLLSPALATIIASVLLAGEELHTEEWVGLVITVGGVGWVITERTPADKKHGGRTLRGVLFGALSALGQAVGCVLSRAAFTSTEVSPVWSAALRMSAAVIVLGAWDMASGGSPRKVAVTLTRYRLWKWVLPAVFLGTYIAVWLQQASLSMVRAGIAQTLLATSPVFALVIARIRGEKVSVRAVLGAVVALLGMAVLLVLPELRNMEW